MMLNDYPVILSEHMTEVKQLVIKRAFEPGQRKGKNAHRLVKVYRTPPTIVPMNDVMISDSAYGRFIAMHPAIWAKMEPKIQQMDKPQAGEILRLYLMPHGVLRGV